MEALGQAEFDCRADLRFHVFPMFVGFLGCHCDIGQSSHVAGESFQLGSGSRFPSIIALRADECRAHGRVQALVEHVSRGEAPVVYVSFRE